jgi:hypothetical protein
VTSAIECSMGGSVLKGKIEGVPRGRSHLVIYELFGYILAESSGSRSFEPNVSKQSQAPWAPT